MDHSSHNMDHADHNMHANNAEENLDDVLDSTDKPTGHENHSAGGHQTSFHLDENFQLLFQTITIQAKKDVASACVVLALLAMLNELLKLARSKIQVKQKPKQFLNTTCAQKLFNGWHFLQTILHLVQLCLSYTLMLAFMTFHAWICIAILVGSTVGYFLFGWNHSSVDGSHCD